MMCNRKHVGHLEKRLQQWGEKLDELVKRAETLDSEAKSEYHAKIALLGAKYHKAEKNFTDFKAAGNGKWDHFKNGIEDSWFELETAFKELKQQTKR